MSPRRPTPEREPVDVIVIGGGAVGVSVARAAAAALEPAGSGRRTSRDAMDEPGGSDARVVLISDEKPGGAARLVADGGVLLDCALRGLDWHATLAHLHAVRQAVTDRNRDAALRQDGVRVLYGRACLLGAGRVAVEALPSPGARAAAAGAGGEVAEILHTRSIVLATGDEPALPELTGLSETRYLTPTTLLALPDLPPSMVVLGGGPAGCELAQALARFGVQVSLVEGAGRLLPAEHPEVSELVVHALRDDGVRVFTGAPATSVAPTLDDGAWVGTADGDIAAEGLLIATGRRGAVRGLDLAAAGVRLVPAGFVTVDERLATTADGVFAAGHVTGLLPHGATDPVMARVAALNALARKPRMRWTAAGLPRVVRTAPVFAAVGVGPEDAGAVPGARISDLPLRRVDRALLSDAPTGLVTLVAGPRQAPRGPGGLPGRGAPVSRLLGASMVGPGAGELADLAALALRSGMSVEELAEAPLSSRTWGAALQHAAAGFTGS